MSLKAIDAASTETPNQPHTIFQMQTPSNTPRDSNRLNFNPNEATQTHMRDFTVEPVPISAANLQDQGESLESPDPNRPSLTSDPLKSLNIEHTMSTL